MKYLPPRPLSRLDGGSASAMFRIRNTSMKKQRRVQLRAQRQTLPKRGRAPDTRKPPKTPWSPAVFQRAAERATPEMRRRSLRTLYDVANLKANSPWAGLRRGAAGAPGEPRSQRLERKRRTKLSGTHVLGPPWLPSSLPYASILSLPRSAATFLGPLPFPVLQQPPAWLVLKIAVPVT